MSKSGGEKQRAAKATRSLARRVNKPATPRARGADAFEVARRIALALPAVEEGVSYGTPAFRVRGSLFARLREDGDSLAIKIDFDERETLMGADPDTFFITDHYQNYPMMLVRLSKVGRDELRDLLEQAWRRAAPKQLRSADAGAPPPRRRTKK